MIYRKESFLVCFLFVDDLLNGAVLIVEETLNLQGTQVGDVVAGHAVVIAKIPLAFIFYDAVVGGPSYDGIENDALIGEWSIGIVTNGIAEEVAVARGVGEIILAVVFECLQ